MREKKVLIVQRIFSDYRKPIFDRLSEQYDLKVLHAKNQGGIKQVEAAYSVYVKGIKFYKKETTVYIPIARLLFNFRPDVVIHEFNPSLPSIYILFLLKALLGFKIILWGHGINSKKIIKKKWLSIWLRKLLAKAADAVLLYGRRAKEHFEHYINPNKIFVAFNTLDTEKLAQYRSEFLSSGKDTIKEELGIKASQNLVFIGRLLEDKIVPHDFIQIIKMLDSVLDDFEVHILGEGPARATIEDLLKRHDLQNVHLYGSLYGREAGCYLFISDLLLNTGGLGLSIPHAFCFGTPVVSFEEGQGGPFHGPEVEYIENLKTGYLAKNNSNLDLVQFIGSYFSNENLREEMQAKALDCVTKKCSIQNMQQGFNQAINFVTDGK